MRARFLPILTESVGVVLVSEYVQRSNFCGYKLPSNRDAVFRTSISVELCPNTLVPGAHIRREWRGVGGDGVGVGKLEGKDVTMGRIFMTS